MTENGNSLDHIKAAWELVKTQYAENKPTGTIAEQWQHKQEERLEQLDPAIQKIIGEFRSELAQFEGVIPTDQFKKMQESTRQLEQALMEADERLKAAAAEPKMKHHSGVDIVVP